MAALRRTAGRRPALPSTVPEMERVLRHSRPAKWFRPGKTVRVRDKMQKNYTYRLVAPRGKRFALDFRPELTPKQMLRMGVFEGKYLNDCIYELPREWYKSALLHGKLSPESADSSVNEFKVKSRQSLKTWRRNRWVPVNKNDRDVRGWFQWYCRYWLGRRQPDVDAIQIGRWRAFVRHAGQILASYKRMGSPPKTKTQKMQHRPKQRQALLQWAYNPYI